MRKKLIFLVLFITFALFPTQSFSSGDTSMIISDAIFEDLSMLEEVTISLRDYTDNSFTYTLPQKAYDIKVENPNATVIGEIAKIPLSCIQCTIKISYHMKDIIKNDNSNFIFSRTLSLPTELKSLDYELTIPTGYIINSNVASESQIVPTPESVSTDGKNIKVMWSEKNPKLPKRYYLSFQHSESERKGLNLREEITEKGVIFLMSVLLLIGLTLGYIFARAHYSKMLRKKEETQKVPSYLLSPAEKNMMNLLRENKGVMNQKEIVRSLQWSKSKVSAVASMLESKRLIKKEKIGRSYRIEVIHEVDEDTDSS